MVGDSSIHWAAHRAILRPEGGNLGLEHHQIQLTWKGVRGAKLEDFPQLLSSYVNRGRAAPHMIIIHMGTNDFIHTPLARMFALVQNAMSACVRLLPHTHLVWSDIVQRPFYFMARDQGEARRCRRQVNRYATNHFMARGGYAIHHELIDGDNHNLFHYDCLHLSDLGTDLFLNNLKGALESFSLDHNLHEFPIH